MAWTISRVSSLQFNLVNRSHVASATADLQRAGQEVSTGRKADIYADLGPRAAAALSLRAREENTQSYLAANGVLDSKLQAMLTSVDAVRDRVDNVLQDALVNASRPVTGASALQAEARAALESIIASLNISYNGDHLFSGTASDRPPLTRWEEENPETGYSPEEILQNIVGAGPTDVSDAQAMIDAIDAIFDSADPSDPARNYEATFYDGTTALDGSGQPAHRVTARIDVGQQLDYGVQANDPAFRDILKGLAMLAATDVSQIQDQAAYSEWMGAVTGALSAGVQGALDVSADIGFHQQIVETTKIQLTDLSLVQRTQIGNYENVDPYEAATRMTSLETQLQASYTVSARLSQLTLLNFI